MTETPPSFGLAPAYGHEGAVVPGSVLAGLWFGWSGLDAWWPTRRVSPLVAPPLPRALSGGPVWVFPASAVLQRSSRFVTRLAGGPFPDPHCTAAFPALGWHHTLSVWLAAWGPMPPEAVLVQLAPVSSVAAPGVLASDFPAQGGDPVGGDHTGGRRE